MLLINYCNQMSYLGNHAHYLRGCIVFNDTSHAAQAERIEHFFLMGGTFDAAFYLFYLDCFHFSLL